MTIKANEMTAEEDKKLHFVYIFFAIMSTIGILSYFLVSMLDLDKIAMGYIIASSIIVLFGQIVPIFLFSRFENLRIYVSNLISAEEPQIDVIV